MSPGEFWYSEPSLCAAYREAWRARWDTDNNRAWMYGMYTYAALSAALSGFSGKAQPYPEEPFRRREAEEKRGVEGGKAYMQSFATAFNASRKGKQKKEPTG